MGGISLLLLRVKALPSKLHDTEDLPGKDKGPQYQSKNRKFHFQTFFAMRNRKLYEL